MWTLLLSFSLITAVRHGPESVLVVIAIISPNIIVNVRLLFIWFGSLGPSALKTGVTVSMTL